MTAQPSELTTTDLEILQALDFQPAIPCEWKKYGKPCEAEASVLVAFKAGACSCPNPPIPTCEGCWDLLSVRIPGSCWHCATCRTHIGRTRDEAFVIVCTLGGAS